MDRGEKKRTVLVVEDDEMILKALHKKLASAGFNVVGAVNGQDGYDKAIEIHPDLILLDIVMPVMDGITSLDKIRQDSWGKDVPVIILTNLGMEESSGASKRKDVHDYLVKTDWSLDDVVGRVNKAMDKTK